VKAGQRTSAKANDHSLGPCRCGDSFSLSLSVVPTLHLSEYNLYQSINTLHTTGHSRIYLDIFKELSWIFENDCS